VRIATVTFDVFADVSAIAFPSMRTFLEYDILIWEPNSLVKSYLTSSVPPGNKGIPITQEMFDRILMDILRRDSEMMQMLELGKTIFIYLPYPEQIYIPNGTSVDLLNYFSFIKFQTSPLEGDLIDFRGEEPFTSFWEKNKYNLNYKAQLDIPFGKPLFFVKGTQVVIGAYSQVANGHVILMPSFLSKALSSKDGESIKSKYIESMITLAAELTAQKDSERFEIPSWSENYLLPGEHSLRDALQKLEEERAALEQQVNVKRSQIEDLKKRKLLFGGSGKPLEVEVKKVFDALGFTDLTDAEASPNRDDLILKYHDKIAVVEIKGIFRKSAGERHAAQLEKWVMGYLADKEIKPKGILVVNAHGEVPLRDRSEVPFPPQMIPFSQAREHCLITGLQLLGLYLDCKDDDEKKARIIDLLFATNGVFSEYQDWTKFLTHEDESI